VQDWRVKRERWRTIGRLRRVLEGKFKVVIKFPQKQKRVVLEERGKNIRIFIKRHSG